VGWSAGAVRLAARHRHPGFWRSRPSLHVRLRTGAGRFAGDPFTSAPRDTCAMLTASEAWQFAAPGDCVIGWKLDRVERDALLARFPPRYPKAVADHVTLRSRVSEQSGLPATTTGVIVGRSDDGAGVEAMVVQIEGSTARPDGGTYHITWSLQEGREARQSNDVIRECGWEAVVPPVPVQLRAAAFPRS
jgi:hypothetical protein